MILPVVMETKVIRQMGPSEVGKDIVQKGLNTMELVHGSINLT